MPSQRGVTAKSTAINLHAGPAGRRGLHEWFREVPSVRGDSNACVADIYRAGAAWKARRAQAAERYLHLATLVLAGSVQRLLGWRHQARSDRDRQPVPGLVGVAATKHQRDRKKQLQG